MGLNNGLTQTTYNSQAIHAYKLSENEHLGLVSLPYGQVQDIAKFMDVTEDGDGNQIKVNFLLHITVQLLVLAKMVTSGMTALLPEINHILT